MHLRKGTRPYLKTLVILFTSLSRGDFLPPQLPSEEALPFRCWKSGSTSPQQATGCSSRPEMIISGGGSATLVGDVGWSLSTLRLCPSWDLLMRPRVGVGVELVTASQQEGGDVVVTRWGWEVERGKTEGGLLPDFTFDNSGDFVLDPSVDDDVDVSMLEERRSSRLISVVERQVPRFGDLVLSRRWKKLPPFAPWW